MYWILLLQFISIIQSDFIPPHNIDLIFGHQWNQRDDMLTIYFDISNSSLDNYRYYYFDFRSFAAPNNRQYFPRQRLTDTHNSLSLIGLHEDDYISCVSFIDEYENIYQPRYTCHEFTLGEKIIGSHHGGSSGYLAPLLLAFAFGIHVFIAIVHYIKAKNYARNLLHRFIDVDRKSIVDVKKSLKQLDHPYVSALVQRRLSRVTIHNDEDNSTVKQSNDDLPIYIPSHLNRKISLDIMKTIHEYNP